MGKPWKAAPCLTNEKSGRITLSSTAYATRKRSDLGRVHFRSLQKILFVLSPCQFNDNAAKSYRAIRRNKLQFISNVSSTYHQVWWRQILRNFGYSTDTAESTNRSHRICSPWKLQMLYNSVRTASTLVHLTCSNTKSFNTLSMTKFFPFPSPQYLCPVSTGQSNTSLTCSILHSFPHPTSKLPSSVLFWKIIKRTTVLAKLCAIRKQINLMECSATFRPEFLSSRLLSKSDTNSWILLVV